MITLEAHIDLIFSVVEKSVCACVREGDVYVCVCVCVCECVFKIEWRQARSWESIYQRYSWLIESVLICYKVMFFLTLLTNVKQKF